MQIMQTENTKKLNSSYQWDWRKESCKKISSLIPEINIKNNLLHLKEHKSRSEFHIDPKTDRVKKFYRSTRYILHPQTHNHEIPFALEKSSSLVSHP